MNRFQYKAYSDHPWLVETGKRIFNAYLNTRKRQPPKRNLKKLERAFITVITGLYLGRAFDPKGTAINILLNRNRYYGKSKYSPVFTPELFTAFKWMVDEGFLKQTEKHKQVDDKWIPAAYRLTSRFTDYTPPMNSDWSVDKSFDREVRKTIKRNVDSPLLEVRNDEGVAKQRLPASPEKDLTIKRLKAYDNRLSDHEFTILGSVISPYDFSLTRIYKNNYTAGGRYYSAFQGKSSQFRLSIQIDGEPVAEVDYKALHPKLLYQLVGVEGPDDPYDTGGWYPRSVAKKAFQILINRSKEGLATDSLRYWLNRHRAKGKSDPHDWEGYDIRVTNKWCEGLESTLRDQLSPVAHFFNQGVGLQLQHYDSMLVSHVIDYMQVKAESIVIPIHDSFLVKQSDIKNVLEAIRYAEIVASKEQGITHREPLLEIEVINHTKIYEQQLENEESSIKSIQSEPLKEDLEQEMMVHGGDEQYLIDHQIEEQE